MNDDILERLQKTASYVLREDLELLRDAKKKISPLFGSKSNLQQLSDQITLLIETIHDDGSGHAKRITYISTDALITLITNFQVELAALERDLNKLRRKL